MGVVRFELNPELNHFMKMMIRLSLIQFYENKCDFYQVEFFIKEDYVKVSKLSIPQFEAIFYIFLV